MKFSTPPFCSAAWQNHLAFRETLVATLERRVAILILIQGLREETGCESLGENIERLVVERELSELDGTI